MTILFFVFLGVMAVATGTTLVAIVRAKEGCEDELGFHSTDLTTASDARTGHPLISPPPARTSGRSAPPDPVMAATAELPSALLEERCSP